MILYGRMLLIDTQDKNIILSSENEKKNYRCRLSGIKVFWTKALHKNHKLNLIISLIESRNRDSGADSISMTPNPVA